MERLHDAAMAIGDAFGTEADCASAAALLIEAARLMGYELRARPVSAIVVDSVSKNVAVMGRRALERLSPEDAARLEEQKTPDFENGHLVVTCDELSILLDPNIRQVASVGIGAPSLGVKVRSTDPESGEWNAEYENLHVLYILDESNRILLDAMESVRPRLRKDARVLVENLRDGATVDELREMSAGPLRNRRK